VLDIVRSIETSAPTDASILSSPLLDGVWYLQYTSPSTVGDEDQFPDAWKPDSPKEGDANIETGTFQAKGTVSYLGVAVETSQRVAQQIFDLEASRVKNRVETGWGSITVQGSFRPSPTVDNRVIVSFDEALFQYGDDGPTLSLGFLFPIVNFLRQTKDSGWLEVTFCDKDLRIGRGNKGTMFVLTRDPSVVTP